MYKFFLIRILMLVFGLLTLVGGFNLFIDPCQQYRQAMFYKVYFDPSKERYLNSGLAKNYDYETAIIGSSMVENFYNNDLANTMNTSVIKLPISGGSGNEIHWLLSKILNHKQTKNIVYGLDAYSFAGEIDRLRYGKRSFPIYLYDDTLLNNIYYLLSIDTLEESIEVILRNFFQDLEHPWYNQDKMYNWMHLHRDNFGRKQTIQSYLDANKTINSQYNFEDFKFDTLKKSFDANILRHIAENQNVNFYIFYPPYSILGLKHIQNQGWFEDFVNLKKYIYEVTKSLKNVKIYDFQIASEITYNLDNYKDITHYSDKINYWMVEKISKNEYLISEQNINQYTNDLRNQIEEYNLNLK